MQCPQRRCITYNVLRDNALHTMSSETMYYIQCPQRQYSTYNVLRDNVLQCNALRAMYYVQCPQSITYNVLRDNLLHAVSSETMHYITVSYKRKPETLNSDSSIDLEGILLYTGVPFPQTERASTIILDS